MKPVTTLLQSEFEKMHAQFRTVAIHHLKELEEELQGWKDKGVITDAFFQQNYGDFRFSVPKELPDAQSIIIIAAPQKIHPCVFLSHGKRYHSLIPPTYVYTSIRNKCGDVLSKILLKTNHSLVRAILPMKLLAARSGLAEYGKNNICYVKGMGSFARLEAFYTNYQFASDDWQEKKMMERCKSCSLCQQHCPTQCIPPNRFLIHADRCLTYFNENTAPFPSWVRPQWHNALVGCMHCQYVCPQNHPVIQLKEPPVTFSEEETTQILENTPRDRIAKTLTKKLVNLDMNEYYALLSRNLSALIKREMDKF